MTRGHRLPPDDEKPQTQVFFLDPGHLDPHEVREWTTTVLHGLAGSQTLQDVLLVVTELVVNAYEHARRPRWARLVLTADTVRVEVEDGSVERPVVGRSRLEGPRGFGMVLVDRLCRAWGITPAAEGKTVWAELERHQLT